MTGRLFKVSSATFCWLVYTYGALRFSAASSILFLFFVGAACFYAWVLYREVIGRGVL